MKRNAKILMLVQSYYLNDPRVRREAETLAQEDHDVEVIALRDKGEPFRQTVNGVCIYGLALRRKYGSRVRYFYEYGVFHAWAAIFALWLHLFRRFRLIQVHNLPDTLIFSALIPKLLGAKVLFDAHESMPESFRIKYGFAEKNKWSRTLEAAERICMSLADHVLTIHEPIRQLFIQRGISQDKISVVMNLPDERLFSPRALNFKNPKSRSGFTLIYAGTVAKRYGLQTAIMAIPELLNEIPMLRLRILGHGDYIEALQNLASELRVGKHVSFEAPVPITEIAAEYHSADVGISPHEDDLFGGIYFSTKVAEYMAVRLPVIVSKTYVMNYYYDESQVAFFAPGNYHEFSECVRRIYKDQSYKNHLIENGLELSRKLSWSNESRNYLSVIDKLV